MGKDRLEILNFNQRNRDRWVEGVARRLSPGTRILDLGAGTGRYRALFAHCDYKSQDLGQYQGTTEGAMKERWALTPLDYVCDAAAVPAPDGSFDCVLCTEVLEHVPEPIRVIREIARLLRPGGRTFISAPLSSGLHQQPFHYYGGFTPHFYRHFLHDAGMSVVSIEPNGHFFLLLLQEMNRGATLLVERRRYTYAHPLRWLLRLIPTGLVTRWFARTDEALPVEEFTVGYHVEAIKR